MNKICPACGKEFELTRADKIYCSINCKLKAKYRRKHNLPVFQAVLTQKTCEVCGKEIEARHHNQKFCSQECAKESKRQYQKLYRQVYKDEIKKKHAVQNWYYRAATCDIDNLWKYFVEGKLTYAELCKIEGRICEVRGYVGGC